MTSCILPVHVFCVQWLVSAVRWCAGHVLIHDSDGLLQFLTCVSGHARLAHCTLNLLWCNESTVQYDSTALGDLSC